MTDYSYNAIEYITKDNKRVDSVFSILNELEKIEQIASTWLTHMRVDVYHTLSPLHSEVENEFKNFFTSILENYSKVREKICKYQQDIPLSFSPVDYISVVDYSSEIKKEIKND